MRSYKTKYSQTALYILLLIVIFIVMGMAKRCGHSDKLPVMNQGESIGDTIDVAILYGPLSYYVYDDTLGGLNYELLLKMEKDLKRPVKLWPVTRLAEALDLLEQKKYDMLASLPADSFIKERFLTTRSVYFDRLVLLQLKNNDGTVRIKSILDLGADTIYVEKDSPAVSRLANLSDETGNNLPVKEVDLSEEYLCMKVATGSFPLAVVSEKTAEKMQRQYPELSFENPISFNQFQVWVLPLSDTLLLQQTDNWLDTCLNSDYYKTLLESYKTQIL